jgi:hypothetical protein
MTNKIRIKDVYSQLCVVEERLNNHIEQDRQATKDLSVRIANLEERYQKAMNNELKHLKIVRLSRKEKVALISGAISLLGWIIQGFIFIIQHFG